jgi:hypothetical protein
MGSYMEIFEARVLGGNLSFWLDGVKLSRKEDNSQNWQFFNQKLRFSPKTLASNISM